MTNGRVLNDAWTSPTAMYGYALYDQTTWNNAATGYKNGTLALTDPDAPNPLMFLPAAGRRFNAGNTMVGAYGSYWTSTLDTNNRNIVALLELSAVSTSRDLADRSAGLSVRCIKE